MVQCHGGRENTKLFESADNISTNFQVPSMRRMGECINDHDKCVEHSILLSEVNNYLESR